MTDPPLTPDQLAAVAALSNASTPKRRKPEPSPFATDADRVIDALDGIAASLASIRTRPRRPQPARQRTQLLRKGAPMNDHDLLSDPTFREALTDVVAHLPDEGQCDVCHEHEDTVPTYCEALPLMQLCEHCHWMTCPDGGDCI